MDVDRFEGSGFEVRGEANEVVVEEVGRGEEREQL